MHLRSTLLLVALLGIFPSVVQADLMLPVNGVITSGVGWRPDPFGSGRNVYHRGVDIAVPAGTPVRATRGGRVSFAGAHGGHGTTVILKHDNGDSTLYGHNSSLAVPLGARVETGQVIAFSGSSGRSTAPHVHYEVLAGNDEDAAVRGEESFREKEAPGQDLRRSQELLMDEAMNSIIGRIRGTFSDGEGG